MIGRNDCSLEFHRSFQRGTANDSLGHTVMVFDLTNFILNFFHKYLVYLSTVVLGYYTFSILNFQTLLGGRSQSTSPLF